MRQLTTASTRNRTTALAAASVLLLAGSLTACGSDDDTPASTGADGRTTTQAERTTGGSGGSAGVPGDEAAIRAAVARSPQALKEAGTARVSSTQSTGPLNSTSSGTVDLADGRFLFDGTVGGGGGEKALKTQTYGEKGKVFIKTEAGGGWSVSDNPLQSQNPLAAIALFAKADITSVGDTSTYGGKECRNYEAQIGLKDVLSLVAPSASGALSKVPSSAKVPVSACIDGNGLTYASKTTLDVSKIAGSAAKGAKGSLVSSETLRITDYGSAPSPKRPAGIDAAKPL